MTREIRRQYNMSGSDVRSALIDWLKAKNLPAPQYVGNTPDTSWIHQTDGSVELIWIEKDDVV